MPTAGGRRHISDDSDSRPHSRTRPTSPGCPSPSGSSPTRATGPTTCAARSGSPTCSPSCVRGRRRPAGGDRSRPVAGHDGAQPPRLRARAPAAADAHSAPRRPNRPPTARVLARTAAQTWLTGVDVDWAGYRKDHPARTATAPGYPFQRRRYWIDRARRHPRRRAGWDFRRRRGAGTVARRPVRAPLDRPPAARRRPPAGPVWLFADERGIATLPAAALAAEGRDRVLLRPDGTSGPRLRSPVPSSACQSHRGRSGFAGRSRTVAALSSFSTGLVAGAAAGWSTGEQSADGARLARREQDGQVRSGVVDEGEFG